MSNNPTLIQATRNIEALEGKYLQVGLRPNPVVGYVGEDIGEEGQAGQQGMFFGQEVVTAGKLRLNRAVASHEVEQARHAWEIQRWRVLNDVRTSAYDVLVAQRKIELNRQLLEIGEAGLRAAQSLLDAQEVGRVDVLQARVEANSARLALETARNDALAAWRKLSTLMGVPEMQPTPLADSLEEQLPEISWEDALGRLESESPELAEARAGVERARCQLARARAGRAANVDFQGAVRYNHAAENTVASVTVAMPLMVFNRNQGNIYRAEAELAAARREVGRRKLVLQNRLAEAFRRYVNAQQQVNRHRSEILPDAKETLELTRAGYEQGEFGYLELLNAQRTYFRVNLVYLEGLRALQLSRAQIDGMLITGGLATPSSRANSG